jgi:hypothetical protein
LFPAAEVKFARCWRRPGLEQSILDAVTVDRPRARRGIVVLAGTVITGLIVLTVATWAGYVPYLSARRVRILVPYTCPPPTATVFGRAWRASTIPPDSWVPAVSGTFRIVTWTRASFLADGNKGAMDFFPVRGHRPVLYSCGLR